MAKRLNTQPWIAAGIPETAGHPWWLYWAEASILGEDLADKERDRIDRAFRRGKYAG